MDNELLRLARESGYSLIAREALVYKYAWAIPDDEALRLIAALGPIVEVGAGTGYWAALIADRGADILAYDIDPFDSKWCGNRFFDVKQAGVEVAADHPDRTLFLCWPPYDKPMAADALRAYRGDRLVFVGEGVSGCTADDSFFDMLADAWTLERTHNIPQWSCVSDWLEIYSRNR